MIPRPSTIPALPDGSPNPEWWITEDGFRFKVGSVLYNYYDGEWGTVTSEPDPSSQGWFDFQTDDGRTKALNSVRVCRIRPKGRT